MASDEAGGNGAGSNGDGAKTVRQWGLRSIGALLPAVTRPAFRSRLAAGAQLMADWPAIVGPALARISAPRQLVRGTLTLACTGPVALELQHLAGQLVERINAHYGRTTVEQLRFVQSTAPLGAAPRLKPPRAVPVPVEIPDMPAGALRDALSALGGAVAQEARPRSGGRAPKRPLTRTRSEEA